MKNKIKGKLKKIAIKIPFVVSIRKKLLLVIWKWKIKGRKVNGNIDLSRRINVSPEEIKLATNEMYDKFADMLKVVDGDWDKNVIDFDKLDVYRATKERFINKRDWDQTDFYKRVVNELNRGIQKWGCSNEEDFKKRLQKIDELYENIKTNEFKLQSEIQPDSNHPFNLHDDISISISREGWFIFEDGRHRLSIAKILKIPKIPVQISKIHKRWWIFKNEILAYAKQNNGALYQKLTHPDLQDIPAHNDEKRFEMINNNLKIRRGRLLDIGAHWGYFSMMFEREGFECYAIENEPMALYFMKRLKRAENYKFHIMEKSIFDYHENLEFDVTLALNIFHHFIKSKEMHQQLVNFLKRLKTREMVFEPHLTNEPQMFGSYKNYEPDDFVEFLLGNLGLHTSKKIGINTDGRPIYLLS